MDRILSREASAPERYAAMDRLKVGVVGISRGAGTSFLTCCLARYLANTGRHDPAVVELGTGCLFDSIGMDKHFAGREWFRFYEALEKYRSVRGMRNMDEGINWILKSPEEEGISLSFEQKLRLVNHATGDVVLCDLSGEAEPDDGLLRSMDQTIAVIDPIPSKMLKGYRTLCKLKQMEIEQNDMIFVINKMNRGVNRRQMQDFLRIRKSVVIPLIDPWNIYTAEYNCRIPYLLGEVKNALQAPLGEISAALLLPRCR